MRPNLFVVALLVCGLPLILGQKEAQGGDLQS